jgi:hypothetical protein
MKAIFDRLEKPYLGLLIFANVLFEILHATPECDILLFHKRVQRTLRCTLLSDTLHLRSAALTKVNSITQAELFTSLFFQLRVQRPQQGFGCRCMSFNLPNKADQFLHVSSVIISTIPLSG